MRVGIVGAGWVTQYHLPAWARLPGVELVAICDPDPAARAARADAYAIADRYPSIEAMLAAAELDAVDISSPRQFHAAHARLVAERDLPLLCQKPLGIDLAEAEALVRDIGARVPFMVHENWRFRPYYRRLKAWLDEGLLGDIVSVRLDFHSSGMLPGPDGQRPALVRQPFMRRLGRMLVMEVLIHHLDALRYLFGELQLDAARLSRSNDEIVGEDRAVLTLTRRADGMPIALSGNLAVQGAPPTAAEQLWIIGTRGTVHLDATTLRLRGEAPREEAFDPQSSYQTAYDDAIAHFVETLRQGGQFETNPRDNLETLRLVERAYALGGFNAVQVF